MEDKWFITFPFKYISLRNKYVLLSGTCEECRNEAFTALGHQWGCIYPVEDLEYQKTMFGLSEISLSRAADFLRYVNAIEDAREAERMWEDDNF